MACTALDPEDFKHIIQPAQLIPRFTGSTLSSSIERLQRHANPVLYFKLAAGCGRLILHTIKATRSSCRPSGLVACLSICWWAERDPCHSQSASRGPL